MTMISNHPAEVDEGSTIKQGDEEDCSSLGTNDESYNVSNDGDNNAGPRELVHRETRWVLYSKIVVLGVILLAAAVSTAGAYIYTERNIEDNFKSEFKAYGRELLEVSQATAASLFDTFTSMSIIVTSHALASSSTFPFVTIPHFGLRGKQLLELSGSDSLAYSPLVKEENRRAWEKYSVENQHWLEEDNQLAGIPGKPDPIYPFIFRFDRTNPDAPRPIPENRTEFPYYFPFWQLSPSSPFNARIVNRNNFDAESFVDVFDVVPETDSAVLSRIVPGIFWRSDIVDWPNTYILVPIYDKLSGDKKLAALFTALIPWHRFFLRALPEGIDGIILEIRNTCNQAVTYKVNGPEAEFLGWDELHDTQYEHLGFQQPFDVINPPNASKSPSFCSYTFHVFPSDEFHERFETDDPLRNALTVLAIFLLTTIVFFAYDLLVQRRQTKVMHSAVRTNNLVRSLFPEAVRDRIMDDVHAQVQAQEDANKKNKARNFSTALFRGARNKKDFEVNKVPPNVQSKPIADLFMAATVMFADIAGFTAWSSVREPSQVFRLLEEIYNSFDAVAKGRKIFKVETIGDCYVAVAGLPTPRKDHAVAMARFATECVIFMNEAVNNLEVELGPDTSDLACRFGLHSGPVTAGVLRGEKSRFQLFGDTVNVAGRMEQTGISNRVQISRQTATCLQEAGKGSWVKPREEPIFVKGKGEMRTFWLEIPSAGSTTAGSIALRRGSSSMNCHGGLKSRRRFSTTKIIYDAAEKKRRLIDWNVDMLSKLLKKIVAMRDHDQTSKRNPGENLRKSSWNKNPTSTVLDEVKEVISLPNKAHKYKMSPENVILDDVIMEQLKEYVSAIASLYRDNPFHSFEHASHVAMSVSKLLSRVVTPDSIDYGAMTYKKKKASSLHRYTYGITSDPITQFACAFSALIHDVDHSGVPNTQLIKENPDLAELYKNKSVAEQNSVDLAWELLMEPPYRDLLNCIAIDQTELNRFRQLVVNSVMATDIADKELGALRRKRWDKAFNPDTISDSGNSRVSTLGQEDVDRKATIVIEHLIQASDVSHTMQHWHVYLKWNEKLFQEMYGAYLDGRSEVDPSANWYKGEIGFFDFYLIPLCKKLKECEVFGVSSDEYLNYATANRQEWESKGEDIVKQYLETFHQEQQNQQNKE